LRGTGTANVDPAALVNRKLEDEKVVKRVPQPVGRFTPGSTETTSTSKRAFGW